MQTKHSSRAHRRRSSYDDHNDGDDEVSSWDSLSTSHHSRSTSASSSTSSDDGITSKLPTLPDLRFEQSYLATIRGFLHEEHPSKSSDASEFVEEKHGLKTDDKSKEDHHHKIAITHSKAKDEHELWLGNLRVEWFPILYVTVRDQLLSPLVQGAVWGLGGLLLTQFRQYLSARASSPRVGSSKPKPSMLRSLGLNKR
ncbi:hypothetical protein PSEUBRA_000133 [Kalmanozyma brasiliensis GHG001]|uniref:Uncharacterized protein n=1 Tax=Kalmanozyma brasiliensis (strain GHG001) TaxID=1365824 RepID=V5EGS3_KALBG|nr:uncharacterized protein PSEUBRA_000133 [Kalmanozyma brasiliensis GHG001]EST09751.1 hypothetical protein PSEUBRA_000133 [Kalmanozyma brasiliensis GHG001]